jgi:hypothetical protein
VFGDEVGVPPDDAISFGIEGDNIHEKTEALCEYFGIRLGALRISNQKLNLTEKGIYYAANDLHNEAAVVKRCFEDGRIGGEDAVICSDTVLKVLLNHEAEGYRPAENIFYTTGRMMGRVNSDVMRKFWPDAVGHEIYPKVDIILQERKIDEKLWQKFYYFPELGDSGLWLWKGSQGIWPLELKYLEKLSDDFRTAATLATAAGIGANVGRRMPEWVENAHFYGGMVGFNGKGPQIGWRQMFADMQPESRMVYRLNIRSAAEAAAINCMVELGLRPDIDKSITSELIGRGGKYAQYYHEWQCLYPYAEAYHKHARYKLTF